MAKIYAVLIVEDLRTFEQVPIIIKDQVKEILKQFVGDKKISIEQYEEIVGEPYVAE